MMDILISIMLPILFGIGTITPLRRVLKYLAFGKCSKPKVIKKHRELLGHSSMFDVVTGACYIERIKPKELGTFRFYRRAYLCALIYCFLSLALCIVLVFVDTNAALIAAVCTAVPELLAVVLLRIFVYKKGLNAQPCLKREKAKV
ncbi:MAG: hypothetical protein II072_04180 [Clostridia bacterium]|nr:hypothetical protein [Clostridia bacterium]MBQ2110791.1 hypothetical protein [Clostridia bacterium]